MSNELLILFLTGGVSRRMGSPKALLPLFAGEQTTFLQRLERVTRGLTPHRGVVSSLPHRLLGVNLPGVIQEHPEQGQLSSLLLGWKQFGRGLKKVMVCLVDHPYVAESTFEQLATACTLHPQYLMWSPSYQRRGGHPVIFSGEVMERLQSIPLQQGARPVVSELGDKRYRFDSLDEAILWDVDTLEDYQDYSRRFRDMNPRDRTRDSSS